MTELLAQFVTEARDLLRDAGEDLMALERMPDDEAAINRLFRSVHTLKGSSGLFEAQPLTRVLHVLEDIFQAVRERRTVVTPELADLALKVLDQVGRWIDHLDQHETLPDAAGTVAGELVAELRARDGRAAGDAPAGVDASALADAAGPPPDLSRWFHYDALIAASAAARDGTIRLISYIPEDGCFFRGEDPLYLALQIPRLQALGTEVRVPWEALADFDPFSCNLNFHALSTAGRAELDVLFRYVPEQVTITDIAASTLLGSAGEAGLDRSLPAVVRVLLLEQIAMLGLEAAPEEFEGRVGAAARVAANALYFGKRADVAAVLEIAAPRRWRRCKPRR